jgi:hypothetical protein
MVARPDLVPAAVGIADHELVEEVLDEQPEVVDVAAVEVVPSRHSPCLFGAADEEVGRWRVHSQ